MQEGATLSLLRAPKVPMGFVDQYCTYYQEVFPAVRSFEQFTYLPLGSGTSPVNQHTKESPPEEVRDRTKKEEPQTQFYPHKWWGSGKGWRARLGNLRLLIQPYMSYSLILPWLQVFAIPFLQAGFEQLIATMNDLRGFSPV